MKTTITIAAFVGYVVAQQGYGNPPPAYGYPSNTTSSAAPYATCPAPGTTVNGCYSCNPAHQYPEGQTCGYKNGCPCLEYASSTPPAYYPTTTSSAPSYSTPTCPAPGTTVNGCYSCNPAHAYPEGQTCVYKDGCPCLEYASSTPPAYYPTTTSSAPSYATPSCPAPGTTVDGCYSCNPAHQYPEGQTCGYKNGCPCLEYASSSAPPHYANTTMPPPAYYTTTTTTDYTTYCPVPTTFTYGPSTYTVTKATTITIPCPTCTAVVTKTYPPVYTTMTVSAYTTYCPTPTTITHEASTYTISKPTTVTLPCSTGCVVTSPVAPPAYTTPTVYVPPKTTPVSVAPVMSSPSGSKVATYTPPAYTGAAVQNVAGSFAAAAAMGALFL